MNNSINEMKIALQGVAAAFVPITTAVSFISSIITGVSKTMNAITGSADTLKTLLKVIASIYVGIKVSKMTMLALTNRELIVSKIQMGIDYTRRGISFAVKGIQQAILMIKNRDIMMSNIQAAKERILGFLGVGKAAASVTAGSGWMGPLALGVGLAAAAGLYALMNSAGGEDTGAPSLSMPGGSSAAGAQETKSMDPMNTGAASAASLRDLKSQIAGGAAKSNTQITVNNQIDPITGKALTTVYSKSPSFDGQSGGGAQVKSFRGGV
jgi:hypothetical protein